MGMTRDEAQRRLDEATKGLEECADVVPADLDLGGIIGRIQTGVDKMKDDIPPPGPTRVGHKEPCDQVNEKTMKVRQTLGDYEYRWVRGAVDGVDHFICRRYRIGTCRLCERGALGMMCRSCIDDEYDCK